MTTTTAPMTIAGVTLGTPDLYDAATDTANEVEIVSRLRKLPMNDFVSGMQMLTSHLHTLDQGLVVDRYVTLLVELAGGEPSEGGKEGQPVRID